MMLNSKVLVIISVAMLLIVLGVDDASASSHFSSEISVGDLEKNLALDSPTDPDGDGIPDSTDNCPIISNVDQTNTDGDLLGNACDPDDDNDTIMDSSDQCPTQAETLNGYQDTDGCPDVVPPTDTDGDGISDSNDHCPINAEDKDFYYDEDGCPDPDTATSPTDADNDGIQNKVDICPLSANNEDGCPDVVPPPTDTDGDGISD